MIEPTLSTMVLVQIYIFWLRMSDGEGVYKSCGFATEAQDECVGENIFSLVESSEVKGFI